MGKEAGRSSAIITGDVVVDHHIYKGERQVTSSKLKSGTSIRSSIGGSRIIYDLLKAADANVSFGLDIQNPDVLQQNAFAEWRCSRTDPDTALSNWHISERLGYDNACYNACDYSRFRNHETQSQKADLVVLDDGFIGFRNEESRPAWPVKQLEQTAAPWTILKMSRPLASGALWTYLQQLKRKKIILIVSIDDLRKENAMISHGLSWERTASDLVYSLRTHGPLQHLRRLCRHIIVTIGQEGALIINDADPGQYQLVFDPVHMQGEFAQKDSRYVIGNQAAFTTGFVYSLLNHLDKLDNKSLPQLEKQSPKV